METELLENIDIDKIKEDLLSDKIQRLKRLGLSDTEIEDYFKNKNN